MVMRAWLFPGALFCAAVAAAVAIASGAPAAAGAVRWNWANVALMQAQFGDAPAAVFAWSGAAIQGYLASPHSAEAQERLLSAYKLHWQAASQAGHFDEALAAYAAGHDLAGALEPPALAAQAGECLQPSGAQFEAETFAGVEAGSLNVPTWMGAREAVLMFSSQPISQSICLEAPGAYTIAVMAANMRPPPVEVLVAWDGWPAGTLVYEKGDGLPSAEETRVVSPAGAHILTLTFANDFSDPAAGIDRNAVIDSVHISGETVFDENTN
jgi:hypothetical protein